MIPYKKTKESQEVFPFPACDQKAVMNNGDRIKRRKRNTDNKKDSPKKYNLGMVTKTILEGLNVFNDTNLTLNTNVGQGK